MQGDMTEAGQREGDVGSYKNEMKCWGVWKMVRELEK